MAFLDKEGLSHLWTHIISRLNGKVDKEDGKGLSSNDYTDTEKSKLSSIEDNANNYVHPNTHSADMITGLANVATSGSYNDLSNKPTIPTIPSSLPADGGNADTVDGKHATDFAGVNHTHNYAGSSSAGGSANSAVKLSSSKTITLQGDVTGTITTDFSGNVNSSNIERRRCSVGQNSTANTSKPWYKFASIEMTTTYSDRVIIFKVSTAGSGSSSYQTYNGILKAHVRTSSSSTITVDNAQLLWEQANTGIDINNFKLAYLNGNIELWVKVTRSYEFYVFEVLQEYDMAGNRQYWTLYTTKTVGSQSEITSGYTQVTSKLIDIQNNSNTANKLNTNAGSATQPVYFENGVPKATSYAVNKTVPADAVFTDTILKWGSF